MFKKKRDYIPIMYYKANEAKGEVLSEEDFPLAYMDKMLLIVRRLHDLGFIENKKFMFYSLPKIMDALEKAGVTSKLPPLKELDTVGIVFGRNYANWWHRVEEGGLYLIPVQLVLYHEKKGETYFISKLLNPNAAVFKTEEGAGGDLGGSDNSKNDELEYILDLCSVKTKYSNKDDVETIAARALRPTPNARLLNEMKIAYHLTFGYLKFFFLTKKAALGYKDFISWIEAHVRKPEVVALELTQYFSINTESQAARYDISFEDLLLAELSFHEDGLALWNSSPKEVLDWLKKHGADKLPSDSETSASDLKPFHRLEIFRDFQSGLREQSLSLWVASKKNNDITCVLIVIKEGSSVESGMIRDAKGSEFQIPQGLGIEEFGPHLIEKQSYLLDREDMIRALASTLYPLIGVSNLDKALHNIDGTLVLDDYLYREGYVVALDAEEEELNFGLARLLEASGLFELAEKIECGEIAPEPPAYSSDQANNKEAYITLLHRMAPYAPLLKKHGKVLCHLDLFDELFRFVLIDDDDKVQSKLNELLKEIEEIEDHSFIRV